MPSRCALRTPEEAVGSQTQSSVETCLKQAASISGATAQAVLQHFAAQHSYYRLQLRPRIDALMRFCNTGCHCQDAQPPLQRVRLPTVRCLRFLLRRGSSVHQQGVLKRHLQCTKHDHACIAAFPACTWHSAGNASIDELLCLQQTLTNAAHSPCTPRGMPVVVQNALCACTTVIPAQSIPG